MKQRLQWIVVEAFPDVGIGNATRAEIEPRRGSHREQGAAFDIERHDGASRRNLYIGNVRVICRLGMQSRVEQLLHFSLDRGVQSQLDVAPRPRPSENVLSNDFAVTIPR